MRFQPLYLLKCVLILIIFVIVFRSISKLSKQSNISADNQFLMPSIESSIVEFNQISYTLEPFLMSLPHFSDDAARDWFLKSTYYRMNSEKCLNKSCEKNGFLFDNFEEHRQVHLALVKNGLYLNDDCGYRYTDEAIRRTFKSSSETSVIYDKAIIYNVPDGWSFQHFLDGVGPKLSHSWKYLNEYPDAKVIIKQGYRFDKSVREIWELLNVKESNRIIHYHGNIKLGAHLLINPCRTPATHPKLWHDARQLYWSLANLTESIMKSSRNKLIYIQRTASNSKNQGRLILNEEPFIEILRQYSNKSSLNFLQYDHSKQQTNIAEQIQLFSQARIIIGVHGGAQSNMNFAQSGTIIIEIMPYQSEQSAVPVVCRLSDPNDLKPCVGFIYYVQSQLLNLSYWILPTSVNKNNNLDLDLTRVKKLLDSLPKIV